MAARVISLAFVRPSPEDHWLNRLTGYASQHNLCHVELFFETVNQCFSIQLGEFASLRHKSMGNPNYTIVSLTVSQKEYNDTLEFAKTASTWNLSVIFCQLVIELNQMPSGRFTDAGMWSSYFMCSCCSGSSQSTGTTFCSKIITEALQFGGLAEVEHLNPSSTTPSRLYEALRKSTRVVCSSVPYKRSAMAACGSIPMIGLAK